MLFRDRIAHKQGEILVNIHTHISQTSEHSPHAAGSLPLPNGNHPATPPNADGEKAIAAQGDIALLNPVTVAEEVIGRPCRCFCHNSKAPKRNSYGLHIPICGWGFLAYQSQTVTGSTCRINCCATTQSFVAIQFRIPMWFRSLAFTGSLKFGFSSNIYLSLTPMTQYSVVSSGLQLERVCHLERPNYFHRWLSYHAKSILSVDEEGMSVLEDIVFWGGYSLLSHCIATWPKLIAGTTQARQAVDQARDHLLERGGYQLTTSDKFHLTRFIQFVEDEDEIDQVTEIICSENPIQTLVQVLSGTPSILTTRTICGNTILHQAFDNVELLQHLLSIGAPIDIENFWGSTTLHIACDNGAWSSAELLVNKGCRTNISNKFGETPLLLALSHLENTSEAIRFCKTLLLRGADAGAKNNQKQCVWHMIADAESSHRGDLWDLYEMLFAAGGARVINLADAWDTTPLVKALLTKDEPLISFLQKVGARCDFVSANDGWNLLHWVSYFGDSKCCQLTEELKISGIDIRTTEDNELTPLETFRLLVDECRGALDFPERCNALSWTNVRQDNPEKEIISPEKSMALEQLLRGVRDRMLMQEIKELNVIVSKIHASDFSSARDMLHAVVEGKVKAKIFQEAETFKAIDLDVRNGRLELAVESIEEFIEASRNRMRISPFDEEMDFWRLLRFSFVSLDDLLEDDSGLTMGIETDGADRSSFERNGHLESREDGDSEDDGWETANEN
ncbi:ankyrin repeat-containing domain protein [Ustulina deusta]|nr:ankyrin repeat-containing domain protein [Ustulina deusta]